MTDTAASVSAPRGVELIPDDDLEAEADGIPLVADFAFENALVALVGKYGTFKTFILLELAFCLAIGAEWYGRRVKRGLAVYVYAEGRHGIRKRLAALKKAYGYTGRAGIFFHPRTLLVSEPAQVAALLVAIDALPEKPVAVFIDTVARNMGGNENSVEDMGKFIRGCDTIRERTGATVFVAHHTGWESTRSRGSTNLPGSVDTEILVERDGDRVTLTCGKQKDAAEFAPITLEAFPMGESIVLRPFAPTSSKLSANERKTLEVVQESSPLKATAWEHATEIPRRSFYACKKRLMALAYVKETAGGFVPTDAGRQVR